MTEQTALVSNVALSALTSSEREVVTEVASTGDTYAVIAERRGVAEQTVKNQMWSAHQKLNASSTIGLYIKLGWLRVPS